MLLSFCFESIYFFSSDKRYKIILLIVSQYVNKCNVFS